ncbi:MAG: folylpolyglutamate synthase/dihydrofolate synthase family protein [Candidatus Omnitrophota bacterium]
MNYRQAQNYLDSFINYERSPLFPYKTSFKLERVARFLLLLGNPHQDLRIIHVAGSKGKGSTCAFTAHILSAAGYKVGLYTSPHLVDVRERMQILEGKSARLISPRDFTRLVEKIRPSAERLRDSEFGRLSYFEIITAIGFLFFQEKKCDFAVIETGLGGRLDATNASLALVAVVTPISYEHTQVLGATLEEIASEKAGIIKPGTAVVITAPQKPAVLKIIRERARINRAKLYCVGKDIKIQKKQFSGRSQRFALNGALGSYPKLSLRLLGEHQLVNAAVAVAAVAALKEIGISINRRAIAQGLRKTQWPGRLELISKDPRIVLDGAQNRESARVLQKALKATFHFRNLILVLGVCYDKDVRGILDELTPSASQIILTKSANPRAMEPAEIKALMNTINKPVSLTRNLSEALAMAKKNASREDLVVVTGSLFLAGEAIRMWR